MSDRAGLPPEEEARFRFVRLDPYAQLVYPNAGKAAPRGDLGTEPVTDRALSMKMYADRIILASYLTHDGDAFGRVRHRYRDCPSVAGARVVPVSCTSEVLNYFDDCATCTERARVALQYGIDHCTHGSTTCLGGSEVCTTCRMDVTVLYRSGYGDF